MYVCLWCVCFLTLLVVNGFLMQFTVAINFPCECLAAFLFRLHCLIVIIIIYYIKFFLCVCVLYTVFMCTVGSEREEVGKECHFNYLIAPISWFNFPPLIPFFFKGEGVCTHAHRCVKQSLHYIVIYTHSHQLDCM